MSIGRLARQGILLVFVVGPLFATVYAIVRLWHDLIGWRELSLFLVFYLLTGLGITFGYHRLLTHHSFETSPVLKATVLILAGMAVQGRAIDWAANHHNHHAFPAMAYHGMTWRQFDLTALIIRARRSQGPLATNASCSSRHASSIADSAVHFNR